MRDECLGRDLSSKKNIQELKCLGYAQLPPVSPSGGEHCSGLDGSLLSS